MQTLFARDIATQPLEVSSGMTADTEELRERLQPSSDVIAC
jgi:hypothetical protein